MRDYAIYQQASDLLVASSPLPLLTFRFAAVILHHVPECHVFAMWLPRSTEPPHPSSGMSLSASQSRISSRQPEQCLLVTAGVIPKRDS